MRETTRRFSRALLPGIVLGLVVCLPLVALGEEREIGAGVPAKVDFATHIQPILQTQCVECHNATGPSAGLALHTKKAALRGGDSGGAILGGPLKDNVLWERISSNDPDYRMPKGGELSTDELLLFQRWIEQGSPWPEPGDAATTEASDFPTLVDAGRLVFKRHPYVLVGLLVLLLLGVRARNMHAAGSDKARAFVSVFRHVHFSYVLVGALLLTLVTMLDTTRRAVGAQEALRDQLDNVQDGNPVFTYFFGNPPKPYRHPVAKTVNATYWRGNCERAPHLFNGGKYRTCTFHLTLCDAERNPIDIEDPFPDGGLYLRFDIKRSPHTAPTMYEAHQMSRVFISPTWYGKRIRHTKEPPILLEVLKPDWEWVSVIKIADAADDEIQGRLYVYQNLRTDGEPFGPKVHLGIEYDVRIANGRIADGSDLWLGNLFWRTTMEPPPKEYALPLREWLHHEPIPEIPDKHPYHSTRGK